MNTTSEPNPKDDSSKPTIIPSKVFAGKDLGWDIWTGFVEQLDWTTPESADKALKAGLYRAADDSIDKERALAFLYSWILHHTELGITEKKLRARAKAVYQNTKRRQQLEAAGKDASPEAVKLGDLHTALAKKEWSTKTMSEDLGKAIRYSRHLKLSPEACQQAIESHWNSLGLPFDTEELRRRIAEEP